MSEELKNRRVCHACASQPRIWACPVCDLDAELSRIKAGHGEAVAWRTGSMIWSYEADARRHSSKVEPLYTSPPSDPGTVIVRRELLGSVAKHLGNWLSHDLCECEGAHCCGRDEVDRDLDKLRALLAQHEGVKS